MGVVGEETPGSTQPGPLTGLGYLQGQIPEIAGRGSVKDEFAAGYCVPINVVTYIPNSLPSTHCLT